MTHTFWDGYGQAFYEPGDRVQVGDRRRVPREIVVQIRGSASQPDYEMKIEVRGSIPQGLVEACRRPGRSC